MPDFGDPRTCVAHAHYVADTALQAPDGETVEVAPPPPPSPSLDGEPLGPEDVPPPPEHLADEEGIENVRKNLFAEVSPEPKHAAAEASARFPITANGPWAKAVEEQKRLLAANSDSIMSIKCWSQFANIFDDSRCEPAKSHFEPDTFEPKCIFVGLGYAYLSWVMLM